MQYLATFLISNIFFIIAMSLLVETKLNFKSKKLYISYFISILFYLINFYQSFMVIRVALNVLVFMFLAYVLFEKGMRESIILGFLITLLAILSEIIYALFTSGFLNGLIVTENYPWIVFINNVIIGIILVVLCSFKETKRFYHFLIKVTRHFGEKQIAISALVIVALSSLFSLILNLASNHLLESYYVPFIGSFLTLICTAILFIYLRKNNQYLDIYEKYDISLRSIQEFEMALDDYRMNTHENKNQLRTIRNMSRNKSVIHYIDGLLDEKTKEDDQLLELIQKIPPGGLRGIIYTKLLLMKNKEILFELSVGRNITNNLLSKVNGQTLTDVCKILGVFLDNSIEAINGLEEKLILIEIYEELDGIVFAITNNYEGYLDVSTLQNPGKTTKGKGHGYGLSLVHHLVSHNTMLEHRNEIIEDNFVQIIKIKV